MRKILVVALLIMSAGVLADDTKQALTFKVEKKDLSIQVELSGSFVAENKDEIRIEPKEYRGDLIVTKILAEGRAVKKGDVLIEFDKANLERAAEDARDEVTQAEVELKKAKADEEAFEIEMDTSLERLQKELSMKKHALEGAGEKASQELVKKEQSIKDARNRLKDMRIDLEQLRQLYKERELHTATETILLAREERNIEDQERRVREVMTEVAWWKKYEHLKDVQEKELDVAKKDAELKKTGVQHGGDLAEKESAVKQAQRKLEKAKKKVKELEEDAKSLQVNAPRDGILFYGSTGNDLPAGFVVFGNRNSEMRVGGRVRTHDTLMTVASMDSLSIKMRVMENDIQHMKQGLPITILPDAFPSLQIKGKLTKVDQVAQRGNFLSEVREFSVEGSYDGVFKQLRSGMNCRVTVHADNVPDAIQVPVVSVFEEEGEHYVFVKSGSKGKKRNVKLGASNGKRVQITEGLKAGEIVYLYDPTRE